MGKKGTNRVNPDYFIDKGTGQEADAEFKETAKQTMKKSKKRVAADSGLHIPGPIGGGTETLRLAQKHRQEQSQKKKQQRRVQKTLEQAAPPPAMKADHLLPPATRSTELKDLWRDVSGDARKAGQAARDFYLSLSALVRSPVRLVQLLRHGGAHA